MRTEIGHFAKPPSPRVIFNIREVTMTVLGGPLIINLDSLQCGAVVKVGGALYQKDDEDFWVNMDEGFITAEELIVKARNNGSCTLVSNAPL